MNMKKVIFITVLLAITAVSNFVYGQYRHKGSNGKYGYTEEENGKGKLIIPYKYDDAKRDIGFEEGLAAVKLNGKWGFIDKTDNVVIPFKYDYTNWFSEGVAGVQLNGKYGYIDKTDRVVIPFKYDYVSGFFSNGVASVVCLRDKHGKWKYGYIDIADNVIIKIKYPSKKMFDVATIKKLILLLLPKKQKATTTISLNK